jgi:hypothetical protein
MIQVAQQQVNVAARETLAEPVMTQHASVNKNGTWHHSLPSFFRRTTSACWQPPHSPIAFEMNGIHSRFCHYYGVWRRVLTEFQ